MSKALHEKYAEFMAGMRRPARVLGWRKDTMVAYSVKETRHLSWQWAHGMIMPVEATRFLEKRMKEDGWVIWPEAGEECNWRRGNDYIGLYHSFINPFQKDLMNGQWGSIRISSTELKKYIEGLLLQFQNLN